jgi:hypothetical protein
VQLHHLPNAELLPLWHLAPADPGEQNPIYGNVADVSDWENWQLGDEFFPVRLFINNPYSEWRGAMPFLEAWPDFIWSDDEVPWVTQKGADLLALGNLTGYELQRIMIAGVGNDSLEGEPVVTSPALYRVVVVGEYAPLQQSAPSSDFFMALSSGRRLGLTERARAYLAIAGFKNFYLEPLFS